MIFNFDVYDFIRKNTPIRWRLPVTLDFLDMLFTPLFQFKTPFFVTFFNLSRREAYATPQVISLEYNLVEKFGSGIFISNVENSPQGFFIAHPDDVNVQTVGEGNDQTAYIGVDYTGDINNELDFKVNVPNVLSVPEADIRAYVDLFNLAGQRYGVIYY